MNVTLREESYQTLSDRAIEAKFLKSVYLYNI